MSSYNKNNAQISHTLAGLSYFQNIIGHRRVLVIGEDLKLASFIADAKARLVTIITEAQNNVPGQYEQTSKALDYKVMPFDNLSFLDGAFDLAIVPDFTALSNPIGALTELRRVIGNRGYCVIASPNPACGVGLGQRPTNKTYEYYKLYDLLAQVFPSVQMVGQSPFVGYAVADLAFDDPELPVSFDSGLLGEESEEIEWFLSICGDKATYIDPYTIVQIPLADVSLGGSDKAEIEATSVKLQALEKDLQQARREIGNRGVKIGSLEKKLEEELMQSEAARARGVQLSKELDNERRSAQKKQLEDEFARRSADIELQNRVKAAEAELRKEKERSRSSEAARDELIERMRSDAREIDELKADLDKSRADIDHSKKKCELLEAEFITSKNSLKSALERAQAAEIERDKISGQEGDSEKELVTLKKESADLERHLMEKAQQLAEAEAELSRRNAIVRDLVVELNSKGAVDENQEKIKELKERISTLEIENAALWGAKAGQHRARVEAEINLATLENELLYAKTLAKEEESKKNSEIEQLAELLDSRTAALKNVNGDQSSAEHLRQVARLEGELQAARWRISELEARNQDAETQKGQLHAESETHREKLRAEYESVIETLKSESERGASARLLELQQQLLAEKRSARVLEDDANSHKLKSAELRETVSRAEARIKELEDQMQNESSAIAAMETTLASVRSRLEDNLLRSEQEAKRAAEADERAKKAQSSLFALTEELNGAHSQITALESKSKEIETNLRRDLAKELSDAAQNASKIIDLEQEIKEIQSSYREQLAQNESLVASMQLLRSEITKESERTGLAGADAARLAGENEELWKKLEQKELEISEIGEEQNASERALTALREEVALVSDKFEHLKEAWLNEQKRSVALEETVAQLRAEFKDISFFENEKKEALAEKREMETELLKIKEQFDLSQKELAGTKGLLGASKDELDTIKERDKTLDSEIAWLKGKIESVEKDRKSAATVAKTMKEEAEQLKVMLKKAQEEAASKLESAAKQEEKTALPKPIEEQGQGFEASAGQNKEQALLLETLTAQLEEREKRATRLERQIKELSTQIKEHESDIAAWEMELKFRNSRISQLESENEKLKQASESGKNG